MHIQKIDYYSICRWIYQEMIILSWYLACLLPCSFANKLGWLHNHRKKYKKSRFVKHILPEELSKLVCYSCCVFGFSLLTSQVSGSKIREQTQKSSIFLKREEEPCWKYMKKGKEKILCFSLSRFPSHHTTTKASLLWNIYLPCLHY